jgi:integrase/recombinase XerD
VAETAVGQAFATFLRLEVAQGAAALDTQRGYWSQVRAWAAWCQAQACCLATASATAIKTYRQQLVEAGYQPASIAHKLAVLRRFYTAAIAEGLRVDNPTFHPI